MNKKELEKMREKVKAENPLLTEDQIADILVESENGIGGEDGASGNSVSETPDPFLAEREALEAEKKALAEEKAAFKAEKEALEAEKEAALIAAAGTPHASGKSAGSDSGKAVTYECKTRCTFRGQYYREGDTLTTSGEVPDFFKAVQEGA